MLKSARQAAMATWLCVNQVFMVLYPVLAKAKNPKTDTTQGATLQHHITRQVAGTLRQLPAAGAIFLAEASLEERDCSPLAAAAVPHGPASCRLLIYCLAQRQQTLWCSLVAWLLDTTGLLLPLLQCCTLPEVQVSPPHGEEAHLKR